MKIKYEPTKCACCGQSETYVLPIDYGTVEIVKAIARCIEKKGINAVHLNKEVLAQGFFRSHHQIGNISRLRAHGLVAKVKGEVGNFLLTKKGADFLQGQAVPRYAIMSKVEGKQVGYWDPENNMVTVKDFDMPGEYWEGIGYTIEEGRVIPNPHKNGTQKMA